MLFEASGIVVTPKGITLVSEGPLSPGLLPFHGAEEEQAGGRGRWGCCLLTPGIPGSSAGTRGASPRPRNPGVAAWGSFLALPLHGYRALARKCPV